MDIQMFIQVENSNRTYINYYCSVGMYMLGHGGLLPVHFYEAF